jgi:excisionase family DNA binding protein
MNIPQKPFYSLEDVARVLDVNYQLIYRLVRDGEMGSTKVGRVYRVSHEDLQAYLNRNRTVPPVRHTCDLCGKSFESALSLRKDESTGQMVCIFCRPTSGNNS